MHNVWTGQAGYKTKDCQILPKQGKTVLKNSLPLKMVCQLCYALAKVGCSKVANETLGDFPDSHVSLSFIAHFGSLLIVLLAYSSNIISLLGSSMGLKTI